MRHRFRTAIAGALLLAASAVPAASQAAGQGAVFEQGARPLQFHGDQSFNTSTLIYTVPANRVFHVTDLIDAHDLALEHLRGGGENATLNVGYGHGYSVRDIIDTVKRVTGRDFPVTEGPRRLGDPVEVVAEASRIRRELGWIPKLDDIETIVRHAWAWEQKMEQRRQLDRALSPGA